jgi:hypothetical protein
MPVFSQAINGQLVPVAPINAVSPPPAGQPVISSGATPNNLPRGGGVAAVGGPTNPPSVSQSGASAAPTLGGVVGNVWTLPFWHNPLALILAMLIFSYLLLRFVHWRG